jgi:TonB-linked SusC/RagA family outer membrane protein
MKTRFYAFLIFYLMIGLASEIIAQTISGKVVSEDGAPLVGVNVMIKGSEIGTITGVDGRFNLDIPEDSSELVFSYVGYKTSSVTIESQSYIEITLYPEITLLHELLIVGYDTQIKKNITGSVASIDGEELNQIMAPNLTDQLQGKLAGVFVSNSGQNGIEPMIRIRGFGSINDNSPLYIIDGIPVKEYLTTINPANISRIQVLKDAASASIYGARAANGVVIIETKKGTSGKLSITFNARGGIQQLPKKPALLNTYESGLLLYQQHLNDGKSFDHEQYGNDPEADDFIPDFIIPTGKFEGEPLSNPEAYDPVNNRITRANKSGTDWIDEIFNTGITQDYNLNISGGNDKALYSLGLGYYDQKGYMIHSYYKRYSLRINTELPLSDKLSIGETLEYSIVNMNQPQIDVTKNILFNAYNYLPIIPIDDIAGNYAGNNAHGFEESSLYNPVAYLERSKDNYQNRNRIIGNIYLNWDIINDLTFKTSLGFDNKNWASRLYYPKAPEQISPGEGELTKGSWIFKNTTWYNILTYHSTFGNQHHIQVLIGSEIVEDDWEYTLSGVKGFDANNSSDFITLQNGKSERTVEEGTREWSLFSLFGKINYSAFDRYLFDATIRRDGSSRFSASNRYAYFPAFSFGWRLSSESFLENKTWLNELKLRFSWGQTGNDAIDPYNAYEVFGTSKMFSDYAIDGDNNVVQPGMEMVSYGNASAKWEATTTTDVGLDITILDGKLSLTADYFQRITSDMLFQREQSGFRGQGTTPWSNVGKMMNKGVDGSLLYKDTWGKDFHFNFSINAMHYQNEVLELSDITNDEEEIITFGRKMSILKPGYSMASFYGLIIDGIFQTQEEVENHAIVPGDYNAIGRYKFRDIDGVANNNVPDGVINFYDNTIIGNPHPKLVYGLNADLQWKFIDFTISFQGTYGNDIYNLTKYQDFTFGTTRGSKKQLYDSWTEENRNSELPKLTSYQGINEKDRLYSTYYVEDGSYLRCNNIIIGFSLPDKWFGQTSIKRFRIFAQAMNLFTLTNYSGLDPDINLAQRNILDYAPDARFGIDDYKIPTPRTFIIGLYLDF